MTTEHVIVCSPPSEANPNVPGTRTDKCHDCGAAIGVAPSSYDIVDKHNAVLVCNDCGFKRMGGDPDKEIHLMDSQVEELRAGGIEDPVGFVRGLNQWGKRRRS